MSAKKPAAAKPAVAPKTKKALEAAKKDIGLPVEPVPAKKKPVPPPKKRGEVCATTREVKEAILTAAQQMGGISRLVEWAQETDANERVFWSQMYIKVLPKEIKADVEAKVKSEFDDETLKKMAREFLEKEGDDE
jgi:hypothetical protein